VDKIKFYNKYLTHHKSGQQEISLETYSGYISYLKKTFIQYLPKDKSSKVLELGAGYGLFLHCLKEEGYENCLGIDVSSESLKIAKNLGIDNIKKMNAKSYLKNVEGYFDAVVAIDFFEHFNKNDIIAILRDTYSALTNNGVLLIQVPNGIYPFGGIYQHGDFTHETTFSPESMMQVLRIAGFDSVLLKSSKTHKTKPYYKYLLWRMIKKMVGFYISFETHQKMDILTPNFIAIGKKTNVFPIL